MGELDEVVPPLNISPQGPAETGRRAADPGPRNRSLASVEGPAGGSRRSPRGGARRCPPPAGGPLSARPAPPAVRVEGVALLPRVRAAYRRAHPPTVVAVPGPRPVRARGMD